MQSMNAVNECCYNSFDSSAGNLEAEMFLSPTFFLAQETPPKQPLSPGPLYHLHTFKPLAKASIPTADSSGWLWAREVGNRGGRHLEI